MRDADRITRSRATAWTAAGRTGLQAGHDVFQLMLVDLNFALGNPDEAWLDAALDYRLAQTCPAPSGSKPSLTKPQTGAPSEDSDGVVRKPPWLTNRVVAGA